MAVIIDMSKAYDRLEWGFINSVLERLGFHQTWRIWIMQCVTTVSYSYLLNDTAQGSIIPQRGIRQGGPLSPYLFILCSEVSSDLCNKVQLENKHTSIKVGKKSPRISHLLFADQINKTVMLFWRYWKNMNLHRGRWLIHWSLHSRSHLKPLLPSKKE